MFWKRIFVASLILFIGMFVPLKISHAQVVINEFSSGTTSDWIELYNTATTSANLSVYVLKDSGENDKSLSGDITGGGVISFSFSNWLNNTTPDAVRLYKDGELVDSIYYGDNNQVCFAGSGESIGRYPDGNNTIERFQSSTRDSSNNNAVLNPCPTPTPMPTNIPTNNPTSTNSTTNIPTQTPIPTNTSSPKPSSTKTPTPTKKVTSTPSDTLEDVLGETASVEGDTLSLASNRDFLTITPQLENDSITNEGQKFPIIAVLFIILGLGLVIFAGVIIVKMRKQHV